MSVAELRALFEKRLADGIPTPPGEFYPQDLERVADDRYLERVLTQCRGDLVASAKLLWTIMKWRKHVAANDISEDNIRMDYLNSGTFFPQGRDFDGCVILIIKCKKYVKGQMEMDEVKKILIYWLDRLEREESGKRVTVFFDLDGASLNNFDVDFIKYMIEVFYYYPKFLNQIVVYQLPWLLTAAFKLVKRLLPPEAVEIMKFATKDTVLKDIVSPEQALTSWGGKNSIEFKFVPEKKINKRVTFATTLDRPNSTISTMSAEDSTITNSGDEILSIEPKNKIEFKNENEEIIGLVKISNTEENPLAFKIRTTGPEKFWVRPSSGILPPKKTEPILITILPGYQNTAIRERFLIMATPTSIDKTDNPKVFSEIWKNALKSDIEEHRLKCQFIEDTSTNHIITNGKVTNHVIETRDLTKNALDDLKKDVNNLKIQVSQLKFYINLSLVLGLLSVLLGYLIYNDMHKRLRDE